MKKRILAVLLVLVLVLGLAATSFAANSTGHQISVKIYKVVLDSSKPLGYQTPVLINTITVVCQAPPRPHGRARPTSPFGRIMSLLDGIPLLPQP